MRARSFLYVCLGILALVAAYSLGAKSVGAQTVGPVECVGGDEQFACAVVNHRFYTSYVPSSSGYLDQGPVPGVGRAIACGSGPVSGTVVMEDGAVWYLSPSGWSQGGYLPLGGAPTPVQKATLGSVKARYR